MKAMKTSVLYVFFSCFKVKILGICLNTFKSKIPTLLALHYVEIHSFTYISNESICLKTLKPKIPTLLALQYADIHSFTYKSTENSGFAWIYVF